MRYLPLLAITGLAAAWTPAAAQETSMPAIMGQYEGDEGCAPYAFPETLPALDEVVDSAALATSVINAGLDKPVTLSLRLGPIAGDKPVRVWKKKGNGNIAEAVAAATVDALRARTDAEAYRLAITPGASPSFLLERPEFCPPRFEKRLAYASGTVRVNGAGRMEVVSSTPTIQDTRTPGFRILVLVNGRPGQVVQTATSGRPMGVDNKELSYLRSASYVPAKLDGDPVNAWLIQKPGS